MLISNRRLRVLLFTLVVAAVTVSCGSSGSRGRLPTEVASAIETIGDDIAQERYDKIYNESSDLWKRDSTAEQSAAVFKTLRSKLGRVENRSLHSAVEQENSGGALKGRVFIVTYQTKFERGEGMETFTLTEQNGKWLLARYFVNSTDLK